MSTVGPWRTSSQSPSNPNDPLCVWARRGEAGYDLGDSKLGERSPTLTAGRADWAALLGSVSHHGAP